jgi:hypothetical protein
MRGPTHTTILTALTLSIFTALPGQPSAATIKSTANPAFLAIYGYPGASANSLTNRSSVPVGGGLGRNLGFGENMVFRSKTKGSPNPFIEFEDGIVSEFRDTYLGGTLMSNKTGKNNPLSFTVQFADFQNSVIGTGGATPSFADTSDRSWIAEICPTEANAPECQVDPLFKVSGIGEGRSVRIEDVSIDLGPGVAVLQGTAWGRWEDGAAKVPPCIKLETPPKAVGGSENLFVTQAAAGFFKVGEKIKRVAGRICLVSANNDWYEGEEPEIKITNE